MKAIEYEVDGIKLITPCPYGRSCAVGSYECCHLCSNYVDIGHEKDIVICKGDDLEGRE